MVGAGGEQLRSVRADPLHNLVQLGAHAIACVLACSLLMSSLVYLVSYSCRPSRRVWSDAIASVLTRLCASVQGLHWRVVVPVGGGGRDSGLGSMQVL